MICLANHIMIPVASFIAVFHLHDNGEPFGVIDSICGDDADVNVGVSCSCLLSFVEGFDFVHWIEHLDFKHLRIGIKSKVVSLCEGVEDGPIVLPRVQVVCWPE